MEKQKWEKQKWEEIEEIMEICNRLDEHTDRIALEFYSNELMEKILS